MKTKIEITQQKSLLETQKYFLNEIKIIIAL
jgi:hypothetical protein